MRHIDWNNEIVRENYGLILSGLPVAMHCHHYSINLQKTLEDTLDGAGVALLFQAAERASFHGFCSFFEKHGRITAKSSKLEFASMVYQNCGLGVIHFQELGPSRWRVVSPSSHYVTGWLAKHGRRNTPGCHFARGWIAGVLEVIYDRPLGFCVVKEESCKMMRDEDCVFQVTE